MNNRMQKDEEKARKDSSLRWEQIYCFKGWNSLRLEKEKSSYRDAESYHLELIECDQSLQSLSKSSSSAYIEIFNK